MKREILKIQYKEIIGRVLFYNRRKKCISGRANFEQREEKNDDEDTENL